MARRRRGGAVGGGDSKKATSSDHQSPPQTTNKSHQKTDKKPKDLTTLTNTNKKPKKEKKNWSCVDSCCWLIGSICSLWWFLLFLYNAMPASFPQYVTTALTGQIPDPPGVKLHKQGLKAKHPVVFVPGIVTGGLELWEGHPCMDGLFRKRLWGGTFGELYKRYICCLFIAHSFLISVILVRCLTHVFL